MASPWADCGVLSRIRVRPFRMVLAFVGILALFLLVSWRPSYDYLPLRRPSQHNEPVNVNAFPPVDPATGRANATFVVLARNSDLFGVEASMREVEAAFNHEHNYPWTFLNEVPFTLDFKRRVRALTKGDVHFGLIPNEQWYPPDWIDEEKYEHDRKVLEEQRNVPYAGSMPYRNMCRFNSGFFFRQQVLDQFKWYWRVEPGVKFPCKIPYDPFVFMIENNKRYSFTIALPEYMVTIPSLWDHTTSFISEHPNFIPDNNAYSFLTDNAGQTYNGCHFWSNFEIGDLDFFRSDAYTSFFEHLDASGNFFYERWGDAPVHSIGVALLLPRDQIHYFEDIGYYHLPFWNCPGGALNADLQCDCQREQAFDANGQRCLDKYRKLFTDSNAT